MSLKRVKSADSQKRSVRTEKCQDGPNSRKMRKLHEAEGSNSIVEIGKSKYFKLTQPLLDK